MSKCAQAFVVVTNRERNSAAVIEPAMIKGQDATTQKAIRATFDRLIRPYATARGIALPVAFKIGSGRKPA